MATTTEVGVKITVDGSEATKSVGSIKSQLKEATAELIEMREKFGDTSDEAVAAAKKVGKLKDSIGDAKDMADAFSPDQKFKAFGQALQGVAGGFAAVQGAMGLMGSESKDVEKMLLKVNSAMALSQGIDSVIRSGDAFVTAGKKLMAFSVVQKIVTAAQWLWNAAMAANPIGAIVVVVAALIAGIVALTSWFMDNAEAAKQNAKAVNDQTVALEKQQKQLQKNNSEFQKSQSQQLALAKAQGASVEAIRALELKLADEKIAFEKSSLAVATNTLNKQKNLLASLKAADADEDIIKKQEENLKVATDIYTTENANYEKALEEKTDIQNKHIVEIAQAETNANKEAEQKATQAEEDRKNKQKEAYAKQLEAQKKAQEERKKLDEEFAKELQALRDKNFIDSIKNENDKAEALLTLQFTNDIKSLNASKLSEQQKNAMRIELQNEYQNNLDAINAKRDADVKAKSDKEQADAEAKRDKQITFEEGTFKILNDLRINNLKKETDKARENEELRYQGEIDSALELLNNKEITEAEYNARREALAKDHESKVSDIQKTESENRIKQDELERKTKIDSAKAIGDSLGQLSDLVGKQTATGKALGVAQALINTYIGASEVLRAKTVLPEPIGTISKVINVATIIATGIKSVKAIIGTKVPNAGGGGVGVSAPSIPAVTPPLPPQLNTQMINGGQINQLASATARAYVVESDVSGNQERINRLNRASRIN
jgi:hypothetical protein